jgi:GAF domain-containing protein
LSLTEDLPQAGRALAVAEAADDHGPVESAQADHERDLLTDAVGEAARLLSCDGAMVYLADDVTGELRFAYDAGVAQPGARELLRDLRLPRGQGLFGSALARGELVYTEDYPADDRFPHHEVADRIVREVGLRSMAAAPMVANEQPLGVLGAFSGRPAAFSEEQLSLLRALAAHAAAAIGARRLLIELRRTLTARGALDEISRRIVDVDDPSEVFQEIVDVASSLLG